MNWARKMAGPLMLAMVYSLVCIARMVMDELRFLGSQVARKRRAAEPGLRLWHFIRPGAPSARKSSRAPPHHPSQFSAGLEIRSFMAFREAGEFYVLPFLGWCQAYLALDPRPIISVRFSLSTTKSRAGRGGLPQWRVGSSPLMTPPSSPQPHPGIARTSGVQ